MTAYVQRTVAENLNLRCANSGLILEDNCPTFATVRSSVCNKGGGPAVELLMKLVEAPAAPLTVPPLLVIVASPAVDLSTKVVRAPPAPLTVPPLLVIVALPAVDL